MSFPKATYMYWQKRFDRVDSNKELEDRILAVHNEHKDFGYRRMQAVLRKEGMNINKKKIQRIMQKLSIQVTSYTRKSRRYNSYKGKVGKIAPNRIRRRFHTAIPHQKITTDTTEFKYYEIDEKGRMGIKKLYLDPFLDMFNGEILSYGISKTPSAASILSAQKKAIELTSDCPYRRDTLFMAETYMDELGKEFESLRKKKLTDKQVMDYIEILLPVEDGSTPQQIRNMKRLQEDMKRRYFDAPDLKDVGNNAYRFINAVSDFATHSKPLRKTANYKENLFARTVEGNPLIDKAYQMVSAA